MALPWEQDRSRSCSSSQEGENPTGDAASGSVRRLRSAALQAHDGR